MRRPLALATALAVAAMLLCGLVSTQAAQAAPGTWLSRMNGYRAGNGLGPLVEDPVSSVVAQTWTQTMAATNTLAHNPLLSTQVTTAWTRLGENVGYGGDETSLFQAFVSSPSHRANLLGAYNAVGIGEVFSGGRLWTTHVFLMAKVLPTTPTTSPPTIPPVPPCAPTTSTVSPPGTVSAPSGAPTYLPLTPARLMDSRPGQPTVDGIASGGGAIAPCTSRALAVTGRGGVPASGVGAVVLNVTATGSTTGGYMTAFPTGAVRPQASSLNFGAGQTIANSVIAKVGTNGQVSIYNDQGSAQVIVDVAGWFPTVSDYTPVLPARLMDTRPGLLTADGIAAGAGAVGPAGVRALTVAGRGGVPATGVGAVVLNVTATGSSAPGFMTAFPAGSVRPQASSLNFGPGQTIANLVIAKVGTNGQVSIYNDQGWAHVIVDVAGWFPLVSDYAAVLPARLMDTRPGLLTVDGIAAGAGSLGVGGVRPLTVAGRGGVPASGVGAVVLNVTATGSSSGGYMTVFPAGAARPQASNLNFGPGQTIANLVIAKVGANGQVSIYNDQGWTDVVVDVVGWFAT